MKNIKLPFSYFTKQKTILALEFGVVISDVAKNQNIEMTREIVLRAEKLLKEELGKRSAKHFACNMNVYTLAILEPKD